MHCCCKLCVHVCHCCCACCHCHMCHLWPCMSPPLLYMLPSLPDMSTAAVHIVAAAMHVICGHGCCYYGLWVLLLPPCVSSATIGVTTTMHVAAAMHIAAVGHAYHCCCTCYLWPCALPLQAMHVVPGPTVQSYNRKNKVSKKKKKQKQNHQPWVSLLLCRLLL